MGKTRKMSKYIITAGLVALANFSPAYAQQVTVGGYSRDNALGDTKIQALKEMIRSLGDQIGALNLNITNMGNQLNDLTALVNAMAACSTAEKFYSTVTGGCETVVVTPPEPEGCDSMYVNTEWNSYTNGFNATITAAPEYQTSGYPKKSNKFHRISFATGALQDQEDAELALQFDGTHGYKYGNGSNNPVTCKVRFECDGSVKLLSKSSTCAYTASPSSPSPSPAPDPGP